MRDAVIPAMDAVREVADLNYRALLESEEA